MDDIRNVSGVVKERKGHGREITGHPGWKINRMGSAFPGSPHTFFASGSSILGSSQANKTHKRPEDR